MRTHSIAVCIIVAAALCASIVAPGGNVHADNSFKYPTTQNGKVAKAYIDAFNSGDDDSAVSPSSW